MFQIRSSQKNSNAIQHLGWIAILIAFAFASFETVWPIILKTIFDNNSTIGFITACFSLLGFLSFIFLVPLFEKIAAKKLFFISLSLNSIIFILFTYTKNPFWFILIAAFDIIFTTIRMQSFGILLRDNSSKKTISKNEIVMFLFANVGWILGPLIAGLVAQYWTFNLVLMYCSILLLLSTHIYAFTRFNEHKQEGEQINIFKNLKDFFERKNLTKLYFLSGGLEFWWCLPYIFIPLEMIKVGLDGKYIGLFLFLLCLTVPSFD